MHIIMDNIVVGISQINIKQGLSEKVNENCAPTINKEIPVEMSSSENSLYKPEGNNDQEGHNYTSNSSIFSENIWEEVCRDEDNSNQNSDSQKGSLFSERRKMPNRASKESSLLGIKRRTIMKPSKRSPTLNKDSLTPAEIKKIYLNKKLTNFRPSSLETIFEETPHNEIDEESCPRLMSARKIRRTICFPDGHGYTKSLVNKRRIKIKKTFGRRFALKKISLEEFIDKLNNSMEKSEECTNKNVQIEIEETKNLLENADISQCPKVFSVNAFTSNSDHCLPSTSSKTTSMEFCTDVSL